MVNEAGKAAKFERVGPNPELGGRDIAVGDIHGCFGKLEDALARIGFDQGRDRLFAVGDLVDRGPESIRALEWLAKPWFRSVCGNHEFMAWRSALGDPWPMADHRKQGGAWLDGLSEHRRAEVGRALSELPLAMEVQAKGGAVGIVHADCPFDDWGELMSSSLRQRDGVLGLYDLCMWSLERIERSYQGEVRGVKAVVHGHVVVERPTRLGNACFIDTGGWLPGRSFTLLDLETMQPAKSR